jgi:hypothetical protein
MSASKTQKVFTASEGRHFGLLIGGILIALAALLAFRHRPVGVVVGVATIGALLVIAGATVPASLGPIHKTWMGMAAILSRVTTPIVTGLMYLLIITPVGLLRRGFGGNALVARDGENGFWVLRTEGRSRSMQRQF